LIVSLAKLLALASLLITLQSGAILVVDTQVVFLIGWSDFVVPKRKRF
jgi:hypothetical protein